MTTEEKTQLVIERNLTLNPETMTYFDDCGNEFRCENGEAIFYSEVNTNRIT